MRFIKSKKPEKIDIPPGELVEQALSPVLQDNREKLRILLAGCSDVVMRDFMLASHPPTPGLLLYFDGLVDKEQVALHLLQPLLTEQNTGDSSGNLSPDEMLKRVQYRILSISEVKTLSNIEELLHHISSGDTVLLIDGCSSGLVAGTRSWQSRAIQTPENEITIYGPKEGLSETLRFNTALLRRRIKSTNFKIENMVIGQLSKTDVALFYIEHIAPRPMVEELKKRLQAIDIDAVLDPRYLVEFVADEKRSIFTQEQYTEKPDRLCGYLLEGRIAVMVDGSPMALIVPVSFLEYLISPEDYYINYIAASLFRLLRLGAFAIALLLPSLYVAVITYHHEMVPTPLLLTLAATRQGVPFPAFVEALLLDLTFELLREAGLRLPRAVGPAVSIVGALIIGDAAVRAGLVSTPMVVIIAATGIASFASPSYNAGIIIRIARFAFLIASGLLGFLGIMIALILLFVRMASLSSLGLPYLAPVAPFNWQQLGDILIRRPWFNTKKRPYLEGMENQWRQGKSTGG